MNHRGGLALIRRTWLSWMQQRSFFFLLAFMWMIPPLIYLLVWSTAADGGTVGGLTRGQFVAYYLVLILVNQLTYAQTNWTVGDVIRYGNMNTLLLRPLSPVYDALASEIAGKVVYMAFMIPLTALLALVLHPELRVTLGNGLAFVPALALAWVLRFFWGYWLALLAFWATRAAGASGFLDLPAGRAGGANRAIARLDAKGGHPAPFPLHGRLPRRSPDRAARQASPLDGVCVPGGVAARRPVPVWDHVA